MPAMSVAAYAEASVSVEKRGGIEASWSQPRREAGSGAGAGDCCAATAVWRTEHAAALVPPKKRNKKEKQNKKANGNIRT